MTTTPATPVNAGTYPINAALGTLASANYSFSFVPGTLTIGQATLTVTAANASRAYGAANPTFSASATGALPGDTFTFTESTTATVSSPVGTYAIVPLAAGASLANYTVVYVNGTLTVGKAVLTVTANNQNIAYGAALPTYTTTLTGFLNGDTQATAVTGSPSLTTTPATPVNAGTYPINAALGTLASANYSFSFVPGTLTIGQATLTVTAANASRAYGAANPTFSASATGALPGDTFTFTESTTATASSPVGTYAIVPLAAGASLANYTVVYVNGTLTVGKAVLTVTANNQNIAYGAALPTYTTTLTGFLNGDTQATAVTGSAALSTTPATPVNAGTYPINAALGTRLLRTTASASSPEPSPSGRPPSPSPQPTPAAPTEPPTPPSPPPPPAPSPVTPSPSPNPPPQPPPPRSAPTPSSPWPQAPASPTTPSSTSTEPSRSVKLSSPSPPTTRTSPTGPRSPPTPPPSPASSTEIPRPRPLPARPR